MSLNSKPTKTTPNRLVLSTKYCDNAHKIRRSLTDCWKELYKSENLREIFPNPPMLAFKGHPSLRNNLVKAKLPTTEDNDNVQETTKESPNTLSQICGTGCWTPPRGTQWGGSHAVCSCDGRPMPHCTMETEWDRYHPKRCIQC